MLKSLQLVCQRCFGMVPVVERVKQELADIEQELYALEKTIAWSDARLKYLQSRKKQIS